MGVTSRTAALFTRMSSRPKASIADFTIASTASSWVTSARRATAFPPLASIAFTTSRASSRDDLAFTTTAAPAPASESAMARPMLRLAPVTSATRPPSSLPAFMPSPPEWREIHGTRECVRREGEPRVDAARVPAAVGAVGAEFLLDVGGRERLVAPAAQVRLAFLENAPVTHVDTHVARVLLRIGVVGIDLVAHLARERHGARIARVLLGEGLEPDGPVKQPVRDAEWHAELRGVGIGRRALRGERFPQAVHDAIGRL